jgi:hypothetical protein
MSDSQSDDNFDDLEISEEAYNKLLEDVSGLAEQIIRINWSTARELQPLVKQVFETGCTDSNIICRLLDQLCDPIGCEPMFKMFIKLLAWLEPHDFEAVQHYRETYYLFFIREDCADLEGEGWDW